MKFSLLAIFAAVLCATAVAGAPSTSNLSFEDLISSNPFNFGDQIRDHWVNVKCIREVLAQETSKEVKALWAQYHDKMVKLHDEEWTKCKGISQIAEQIKCKALVIEKSIETFSEFFTKLVKVADWQKAREIGKKILTKCLNHNDLDESEDAEEFAAGSLPEQFQCLVDVVGEISKNNGLEELWSKSQPQLQQHLDSWRGCANVEGKLPQILCNIKEGVATYRLITDYIRLVAAQKPVLVTQIVREVQDKCSAYQSIEDIFDVDEIDLDGMEKNILENFKCISNAITDGLKDTDFEKPWNSLKKDLEKLAARLKACKNQSTFLDMAKCIVKETTSAKSVVERFLKNVEKVNKEAYDRVKKYIKQRCQ